MRRRKKSALGSLDSLLDTMTNVVGILVILLAVTQLGVGDAVKRIREKVATVSEDEFAQAQQEFKEIRERLFKDKREVAILEATAPEKKRQLDNNRRILERLKIDLTDVAKKDVGIEDVRKLLTEQQELVNKLEADLAASAKQIAKLKAQLDETPPLPPPPDAKLVYLPNPRAAPKNTTAVEFVCQHGRIVPLNVKSLVEIAQKRIDRSSRVLKQADGSIDCQALKALFENEDIGNGFFRLKIVHNNRLPQLLVEHRVDVGDTPDSVSKSSSLYQEALRDLDRRTEYIRFRVYPDSFDTYLAARQVASKRYRLAAGWAPYESTFEHRLGLGLPGGVFCSGYKPPPKTKTAPKKKKLNVRTQRKPKTKSGKPATPPRPPLPNDDID